MKYKLPIAFGGILLVALAAYVGFFAGQVQAAIKWSWVPKEHNLLYGSMERIELLLSAGDTGTVIRAVSAYNKTIKSMTNEFDFFRAADALWENTKERQ